MVLLSIGFVPEKCDIYEKLGELSTYFNNKDISIGLVESDNGSIHFVKCIISDEDAGKYCLPEVREAFNVYAASLLYDVIVDNFEIDAVSRIIKENYYYFKPEEVCEIKEKCRKMLSGTEINSNDSYVLYLNRKSKIMDKILEYIAENIDIVLEGFLRFRLKEINAELEEVVDRVVEEYLVEKEYNEFIKLLKYFVDIQESVINTVNIVIEESGIYSIYDGSSNEITDELQKEMLGEMMGGEVNHDDLLVSSLITAAPKEIIIHNISNIKNKEIVETIKNVFGERVRICSGCELCLNRKPVHRF